jgi:tetratricopeptide (TPR) repeat protein
LRSVLFPEKPYEPGGWELFAPLRRLYEAGDYAEAAERGRELLAGDPPYATLFHNVACCESLAGQKDEAIAHLRRAIQLSKQSRSFLEGDSDLDPIREDPAFKELARGVRFPYPLSRSVSASGSHAEGVLTGGRRIRRRPRPCIRGGRHPARHREPPHR